MMLEMLLYSRCLVNVKQHWNGRDGQVSAQKLGNNISLFLSILLNFGYFLGFCLLYAISAAQLEKRTEPNRKKKNEQK